MYSTTVNWTTQQCQYHPSYQCYAALFVVACHLIIFLSRLPSSYSLHNFSQVPIYPYRLHLYNLSDISAGIRVIASGRGEARSAVSLTTLQACMCSKQTLQLIDCYCIPVLHTCCCLCLSISTLISITFAVS